MRTSLKHLKKIWLETAENGIDWRKRLIIFLFTIGFIGPFFVLVGDIYSGTITSSKLAPVPRAAFLSSRRELKWFTNVFVPPIAAGGFHTAIIKSDGTVWTWGNNEKGQLGIGFAHPKSVSNPVEVKGISGARGVSAGEMHTVALKGDGTVWTWGANSLLPIQVKELKGAQAIAAGSNHNIALLSDGTVWGWGLNNKGQLGIGNNKNSLIPAQVQNLSKVKSIFAGSDYNVAVTSDGKAWGWGTVSGKTSLIPATLDKISGSSVTSIAINDKHVVTVYKDGSVLWDGNKITGLQNVYTATARAGEVIFLKNDGTVWIFANDKITQVLGLTNVARISAGIKHNVAVQGDGTIWTWGNNDLGQLGTNKLVDESKWPLMVERLPFISHISSGLYHTAALGYDGSVWTWGKNSSGQLGNDTKKDSEYPVPVVGLPKSITKVATGYSFNVALESDGTVWGWGSNSGGQLAKEGIAESLVPVQIAGLPKGIEDIAAGGTRAVALRSYGEVWEWGNGIKKPVKVEGIPQIKEIAAGYGDSLGLDVSGNVWSWGKSKPVKISTISDVTDIAASGYVLFARTSDGKIWVWGNYLGKVIDKPEEMPDFIGLKGVAGGDQHIVFFKDDHSAWSIGDNDLGQLGDGTNKDSNKPVMVSGLSDVVGVSAGMFFSIALKSDGTVSGWGYNFYGQLGNGSKKQSSIPLPVPVGGNSFNIAAGTGYKKCEITNDAIEVCDGIDNDCNGSIDEGFQKLTCGIGACQQTVDSCAGGKQQTCAPLPSQAEKCDGIDNDCNGKVDDAVWGPITCGEGICKNTILSTCVDGKEIKCVPLSPKKEECNAVDDDCDGVIDNNIEPKVYDLCSSYLCKNWGWEKQPLAFDDGNPCTDDLCDPKVGIIHAGNSVALNSCDSIQDGCPVSGTNVCDPNLKQPLCEPNQSPVKNKCGGCGFMGMKTGDPCDLCGVYIDQCQDENTLVCVDEGKNACGGCGAVPQEVCGDSIDNDCNGLVDDGEGCTLCEEGLTSKIPLPSTVQKGTGEFAALTSLPLAFEFSSIADMALVDVNNDKYPDIVIAGKNIYAQDNMKVFNTERTVRLFVNNGDGTFKEAIAGPNTPGIMLKEGATRFTEYKLKPADIDNDGDIDILVLATPNDYLLINKDGKGHFIHVDLPSFDLKEGCSPTDAVLADFNGDKLPDIFETINKNTGLFTEYCSATRLLINNGGQFADESQKWNLPKVGASVYVNDINNDGKVDVILPDIGNHLPFGPWYQGDQDITGMQLTYNGFGWVLMNDGSSFQLVKDGYPLFKYNKEWDNNDYYEGPLALEFFEKDGGKYLFEVTRKGTRILKAADTKIIAETEIGINALKLAFVPVRIVDIDNDGHVDFIAEDDCPGDVKFDMTGIPIPTACINIFHNDGNWKFSITGNIPPNEKYDVLDLDGDGDKDIVTSGAHGAFVFKQVCGGKFNVADYLKSYFPVKDGDRADQWAGISDINGDGYLDVFARGCDNNYVPSQYTGSLTTENAHFFCYGGVVYLNDGKGGLKQPVDIGEQLFDPNYYGSRCDPLFVDVGIGKKGMICSGGSYPAFINESHDDQLIFKKADLDALFPELSGRYVFENLKAADFNGDGHSDLVTGSIGKYDGIHWSESESSQCGKTSSRSKPHIFIYENGQYKLAKQDISVDSACLPKLSGGTLVENVEIGDLNNDKLPDIVLTSGATKFKDFWYYQHVFINKGSAGFEETTDIAFEKIPLNNGTYKILFDSSSPAPVILGDVNGDGAADMLVGDARFYLNDGTGKFIPADERLPAVYPTGWKSYGPAKFFDADGDGDLDIVSSLGYLLINDNGWFKDATDRDKVISTGLAYPFAQNLGNAAKDIAIGDIDKDGDDDLFFVSGSGNNVLLYNIKSADKLPFTFSEEAGFIKEIFVTPPSFKPTTPGQGFKPAGYLRYLNGQTVKIGEGDLQISSYDSNWVSVSNGTIYAAQTGSAVGKGSNTAVTVTYKGSSAVIDVILPQQLSLASYTSTMPMPSELSAGGGFAFAAKAVNESGTVEDVTASASWHLDNPAMGTLATGPGWVSLATGNNTGAVKLIAEYGGLRAEHAISITMPQLLDDFGLFIACKTGDQWNECTGMESGGIMKLTAHRPWSVGGGTIDITSPNSTGEVVNCWTDDTEGKAIKMLSPTADEPYYKITGIGWGMPKLICSYMGKTKERTIQVTFVGDFRISPPSANVNSGDSIQFKALFDTIDPWGNKQDVCVNDYVNIKGWTTSDPSIASFKNSSDIVDTYYPGQVTIKGRYMGGGAVIGESGKIYEATAALSVVGDSLVLSVTPENIAISNITDKVQLAVKAKYKNGAEEDISGFGKGVVYSSDNPSVAVVSPGGLVSGNLKGGNANITVTFKDVSKTISAAVSIGTTATGIYMAPSFLALDPPETASFKVFARLSDNTASDVTTAAGFSVSNAQIATVGAGGVVTCTSPGHAAITAKYQTLETTIPVDCFASAEALQNTVVSGVTLALAGTDPSNEDLKRYEATVSGQNIKAGLKVDFLVSGHEKAVGGYALTDGGGKAVVTLDIPFVDGAYCYNVMAQTIDPSTGEEIFSLPLEECQDGTEKTTSPAMFISLSFDQVDIVRGVSVKPIVHLSDDSFNPIPAAVAVTVEGPAGSVNADLYKEMMKSIKMEDGKITFGVPGRYVIKVEGGGLTRIEIISVLEESTSLSLTYANPSILSSGQPLEVKGTNFIKGTDKARFFINLQEIACDVRSPFSATCLMPENMNEYSKYNETFYFGYTLSAEINGEGSNGIPLKVDESLKTFKNTYTEGLDYIPGRLYVSYRSDTLSTEEVETNKQYFWAQVYDYDLHEYVMYLKDSSDPATREVEEAIRKTGNTRYVTRDWLYKLSADAPLEIDTRPMYNGNIPIARETLYPEKGEGVRIADVDAGINGVDPLARFNGWRSERIDKRTSFNDPVLGEIPLLCPEEKQGTHAAMVLSIAAAKEGEDPDGYVGVAPKAAASFYNVADFNEWPIFCKGSISHDYEGVKKASENIENDIINISFGKKLPRGWLDTWEYRSKKVRELQRIKAGITERRKTLKKMEGHKLPPLLVHSSGNDRDEAEFPGENDYLGGLAMEIGASSGVSVEGVPLELNTGRFSGTSVRYNRIEKYSNYGNLDFVAPVQAFGGTSSAAPYVAGLSALILSHERAKAAKGEVSYLLDITTKEAMGEISDEQWVKKFKKRFANYIKKMHTSDLSDPDTSCSTGDENCKKWIGRGQDLISGNGKIFVYDAFAVAGSGKAYRVGPGGVLSELPIGNLEYNDSGSLVKIGNKPLSSIAVSKDGSFYIAQNDYQKHKSRIFHIVFDTGKAAFDDTCVTTNDGNCQPPLQIESAVEITNDLTIGLEVSKDGVVARIGEGGGAVDFYDKNLAQKGLPKVSAMKNIIGKIGGFHFGGITYDPKNDSFLAMAERKTYDSHPAGEEDSKYCNGPVIAEGDCSADDPVCYSCFWNSAEGQPSRYSYIMEIKKDGSLGVLNGPYKGIRFDPDGNVVNESSIGNECTLDSLRVGNHPTHIAAATDGLHYYFAEKSVLDIVQHSPSPATDQCGYPAVGKWIHSFSPSDTLFQFWSSASGAGNKTIVRENKTASVGYSAVPYIKWISASGYSTANEWPLDVEFDNYDSEYFVWENRGTNKIFIETIDEDLNVWPLLKNVNTLAFGKPYASGGLLSGDDEEQSCPPPADGTTCKREDRFFDIDFLKSW